jgi:hypothetical protein
MSSWFLTPEEWLVRSSLAGGVLLLVGVLLMWLTPQPARRQRIGELALGSSLLVAILCALPAWSPWSIPLLHEPTKTGGPPAERDALVVTPVEDDALKLPVWTDERLLLAVRPEESAVTDASLALATTLTVAAPEVEGEQTDEGPGWQTTLSVFVAGYGMMMVLLFGRCLLGHIGLRRMWSASSSPSPPVARLFAHLTQGWWLRPRLGVSSRVALPVSFGLWRPTVLIPASFCHPARRDDLRQVLVHELTHLARLDSWSCLLVAVGQAIYFYLPWFWWVRKQVRLCQEFVADAAAAALTSTEDYAEYLVSLTGYAAPRLPVGARVMGVKGSNSELFRRVTMLLNSSHVENRPPRWWSALTAGAFLAVAVIVSGVGLRATARADEGKSDVTVQARIGDDQELEVILVSPDPSDEKRFIVVSPKETDAHWLMDLQPHFAVAPEQVLVWAELAQDAPAYFTLQKPEATERWVIVTDPAGKEEKKVMTFQPSGTTGGQRIFLADPTGKGEKQFFTVQADPSGERRVIVVDPEGKGEKKTVTVTAADALKARIAGAKEARQVEVVETTKDGKRYIIIIVDDDAKKEGAAKTPLKLELVKPAAEKAKRQADEAAKRALELIKARQGENDPAAAKKLLEEVIKKAEPKQEVPNKQVIEEIRKAIEKHTPQQDAEQLQKAMEAYRKALEEKVAPERLKKLQLDTKAKVEAEIKKAEEAAREAKAAAEKKLRVVDTEAATRYKAAAEKFAEAAKKGEYYAHVKTGGGKLGVSIAAPSEALMAQLDLPKGQGLVIESVAADSPAAKAGFKAHDVLVEFNGKPVSSDVEAFVKAVSELKAGTKVDAQVLRKGRKTAVRGVVLADADPDRAKFFEYKLAPGGKLELKTPSDLKDFQKFEWRKAEPFKKLDLEKSLKGKDLDALKKLEGVELELKGLKDADAIKKLKDIELKVKDVKLDELKEIELDFKKKPTEKGKSETSKIIDVIVETSELGEPAKAKPGDKLYSLKREATRTPATVKLFEAKDAAERKVNITMTRDGDKFTVKSEEQNLVITVTGKVKDGKAAIDAIQVDADGAEKKYDDLDKAPENVQKRVKKLIELTEKGKVDFNIED